LSKIDNIIGVKEASADLSQIARIIDGTEKDFIVYSGNDADTFPILGLGGYGVIGVITHLVGKQYKKMMDDFFAGKIEASAKLHRHFIPLVNTMFMIGSPMPIKYALNYLGFRVGKPRLPLVEPDEKTRAAIEQMLKNYKIDLPLT
ncbi:MAG: dihydrodipicolinate synthase family protein, partial [Chloroflexi bacterium]|nr:dihydrodipicolinate synthase family protein [Chloroflexota bacterium]